jgi:hypothetical protein
MRIFLCFEPSLDLTRFAEGFHFLRGSESQFTKAANCMSMGASVLLEPFLKIDGRSNIVAPGQAPQDVNPSHLKMCQGGELNSRPRAYESPALPLSYPGV